jgi:hypothetical protein
MLLPPSERLEALERLAGRRPNNPYAAVEPPKLVDVYLGAKSDVEKEGKRMELWFDILVRLARSLIPTPTDVYFHIIASCDDARRGHPRDGAGCGAAAHAGGCNCGLYGDIRPVR